MSMGRNIQGKVEVEALKQPKPEEPKSRESSICEGTLVTRSQALEESYIGVSA
jgi:hypothetical protein